MAEYIEREALIAEMEKRLEFLVSDYYARYGSFGLAHTSGFTEAIDYAYHAPIADVAPVVRCKDCKHGSLFNAEKRLVDCPYYDDQTVDFDHFCSYGERRDSDG